MFYIVYVYMYVSLYTLHTSFCMALVTVSGSGPDIQAVNKSTLQRQKEAFSTKLQHFKVMMARLGFSQVLLV